MAEDIVGSILQEYKDSAEWKRAEALGPKAGAGQFNVDEFIGEVLQPKEKPSGPVVNPTTDRELRQGKTEEDAWYEATWKRLTQNPDEIRAKAANALALAQEHRISPSEAFERHDELARKEDWATQPTNKEFVDKLMSGAVVAGLMTSPLSTVIGVSGFAALSEMESAIISKMQGKKYRFGEQKGLADLVPDASRDAETFLEILDFVGKGAVLGVGMKAGKEYGLKADKLIKEKFLRDTFEEYRLPETVYFSSEKMREFFGTGEKITPEEYDLIQSLGLDAKGYRDALKYGIDVEIPAERIVRVVDKPWWAKVKQAIRLNPYEEVTVEGGGGPVAKRPVSGLLEEGNVAEEAMRPFADILKDINEAFGETGAVSFSEKGLRDLTPEQVAARERLKRDFEVAKRKAQEAGEDIATFLKKMGIDEKVATYMIGEFGGEEKRGKAKYVQTRDDLIQQGYSESQVEYLLNKQKDRIEGFADASSWTAEDLATKGEGAERLGGDEEIVVYRAVPKGKGINIGDYIFTDKAEADAFLEEHGKKRGQPEIVSMRVKKSDLIIPDKTSPGEAIYAPKTTKPGQRTIVINTDTGPERIVIESQDPLFEVDRTISEMAATPDILGESPSYEQIRKKAAQQALEVYEKRVDIRKKREAAMLRRHAEGVVAGDPVYAVMNATVKAGGFNYDALRKDYGEETVRELMKKRPGIVSKEGKAYLDTAADEYGFPSADAMMNAMLDAPAKAEAVAREVRSFEQAFGDELEADYSDLYAKMIDEEAKIMAKLTAGYKPRPTPGIKGVIREKTGQVLVGDLVGEYDALKAGMKKAERASREAWIAGQREGAILEKMRERAMAQMLKERLEAKQEAKKLKDDLIKILKLPVSDTKGIPPEYMDRVQELLQGYDLMPRGPKTAKKIESLREFLERHEGEGEAAGIPKSLIDRIDKKPWKELTLDELRDLHDAAEMIVHLGRLKNKLLASKKARTFADAVQTITGTIKANYPNPGTKGLQEPLIRENKTITDKMSESARQYRNELIKPEYIFRRLDKWKDLGPVWEELFEPFNVALNSEYARGDVLTKKLMGAFEPFTKGIRGGVKWAKEKHKIPGVRVILTKEQMIMVALNSGNEGNLNALRFGNKFTDAEIDAINGALSADERALVNTVWDTINSMADDLSGVYRELTGTRMRRVQGKYFPLMFDRELSWRADSFQAESEARDFFKTIYTKPAVEKGFTKERTGGKLPVRLDFGVIFKHVTDVNHYITHALPVRDVQRLITNPEIRAIIVDRFGKEMYDQFMPWLQEMAKPRREPLSKTEKWLDRVRANATVVMLATASVGLQQPLSLMPAMEELGFFPMIGALSKFYTSPRQTVAFVKERSEMMAHRMDSYDREVQAIQNKFDPTHRGLLQKIYFLHVGLLDVASAYPTWIAGYKQGMEKWGSEGQAVKYADMIVRKSQGTSVPKDFANIQIGGSTKKLLTMFYTYFSSMHNQMAERAAQLGAGHINIWDYMKAWWWIIIIPALVSDLIRDRRVRPPHEMAKSVVSYRIGGYPFIRDLANPALSGFDYTLSPVTSAGKEIGDVGKDFMKVVEPGERVKMEKFAEDLLMATGYVVGIPSRQLVITAEGVIDLASGKTKDPTRLFMKEQPKTSDKRFR